ncbi:hypothetical protein D3C85_1332190 [compost metagenome]
MRALTEQTERHVHAGDRRTQFMGGAQHEFAAYSFEGALLGNVMQHHYRAENMALGMTDRRQAVGQQARLAIDLDVQILRCPLQRAAA